MKPSERDELLGRLDERSLNTYKLVEKQEKHLSSLDIRVTRNTNDIKWIKRIGGGAGTVLTAIVAAFKGMG